MKKTLLWIVAAGLVVAGCGSSSDDKPPTQSEVKSFKGNPTSPDLQRALRAHFGGAPSAISQPGAATTPGK